jgi:hypothetical protein
METMINNDVDNNKNKPIKNSNYLAWLLVYMSIALAISFIIPFPISLGVVVLVLVLLNVFRTDLALKRQGMGGIKGLYKSISSRADRPGDQGSKGFGYAPIKFYCMDCGYEHRNEACPKCGSKTVKVG